MAAVPAYKVNGSGSLRPYYIGQPIVAFGSQCVVSKLLPAATIEVETLDGERTYRISGLWLLIPDEQAQS